MAYAPPHRWSLAARAPGVAAKIAHSGQGSEILGEGAFAVGCAAHASHTSRASCRLPDRTCYRQPVESVPPQRRIAREHGSSGCGTLVTRNRSACEALWLCCRLHCCQCCRSRQAVLRNFRQPRTANRTQPPLCSKEAFCSSLARSLAQPGSFMHRLLSRFGAITEVTAELAQTVKMSALAVTGE
jgi:hypothetical protein